ncbi:hypothetical protein CJ030_MR5G015899 [Morella rubra]|uniref:Uncharacterized protein n=1 Tax=Morella rubra TaxID=262757 RepID=A0A6A1VK55_9ROSI|nr:hypothetical protein CJ030_MR5G015899 [Morella rubra]
MGTKRFVQTHLCTKLLNKRGSSAGQRRFYGVVSEDNTEENIGLAICGDIGVFGGSKNVNIVVGFVGFVGVKAFERLVSGQAPVRSAIEMRFEGGICHEDLKNLLPVEVRMMTVQTWEMTGDMRLECGETMANRAKRQRAVAPCPSSPPPVFNNVVATTSYRQRSQLVPVMPAPTLSTPASGDFETRASSQPTLAPSLGGMTHSNTGSTSNSGRRSKTCGLTLDKVRATQLDKLSVSIPDNCAADVGENSAKLSTQIGLLVRGTIPMATSS